MTAFDLANTKGMGEGERGKGLRGKWKGSAWIVKGRRGKSNDVMFSLDSERYCK